MHLSVVLPCYNEEANIEQTVRDVFQWFARESIDGEVLAVNDGSKDGTLAVLGRLKGEFDRLRIVNHEVNKGYGAAIRSGSDAAQGEVIVYMDSDGQFHAEDIGRLLPLLGQSDFVTGVRVRRADPFNRKLNAWLYGLLVRFVLGIKVKDLNCGMKAYRRSLWPRIRPTCATGALLNAELFLNLRQLRVAFQEVPVPHYPRKAGNQTGSNLKVIIRMFRELFALKRASRERFAALPPSTSRPQA